MIQPNSIYSKIMPTFHPAQPKKKTKSEEVKEIIQDPNDPLAKYPLRALGYSNEAGAAVSAMPVWGKTAEVLLWIPALMYLGADIYDKYRRGKEGDYSKASASAAVEQAIFQALASVILPTSVIKIGQSAAGQATRADGSNLSAAVKEELLEKLQEDFSKAKFVKGDRIDENGIFKTGKQCVWERIYDQGFLHDLDSTRDNLRKRGFFKRVIDFFGHSSGLNAASKANRNAVEKYLKSNVDEIFEKQLLIETGTFEDVSATGNKKLVKAYKKALAKAEKNFEKLINERPNFIVEKILSSSEEKYRTLADAINADFPSINDKKLLVAATDKSRELSAKVLEKLSQVPDYKKLIDNIAQKAELSNEIINKFIQGKKLKLGLLKTAGGFVALGCFAVPIDRFVHKYIIKKFVEPGIDNVKNIQDMLPFKNKK